MVETFVTLCYAIASSVLIVWKRKKKPNLNFGMRLYQPELQKLDPISQINEEKGQEKEKGERKGQPDI